MRCKSVFVELCGNRACEHGQPTPDDPLYWAHCDNPACAWSICRKCGWIQHNNGTGKATPSTASQSIGRKK